MPSSLSFLEPACPPQHDECTCEGRPRHIHHPPWSPPADSPEMAAYQQASDEIRELTEG